jgi:glycosyltransferase involved in cell wall biosynthesis
LISQTFSDWEWVVVDDGSVDDSAAILAQLSLNDARVKIFTLNSNMGRGYARNFALKMCRADYVVIWDVDDLYLPKRLELIQASFDQGYDFFVSYALIVDSELRLKGARHFRRKTNPFEVSFVHPTLAFNKCAIGSSGYDESMRAGEDLELMIVFENNCNGFYCPEYLMLYVEDREINLYKTISMQSSHLRTIKRIIERDIVKSSLILKIKILSNLHLKSLILFLLRCFPRSYSWSVQFRYKNPILSSLLTSDHLFLFKRFANA